MQNAGDDLCRLSPSAAPRVPARNSFHSTRYSNCPATTSTSTSATASLSSAAIFSKIKFVFFQKHTENIHKWLGMECSAPKRQMSKTGTKKENQERCGVLRMNRMLIRPLHSIGMEGAEIAEWWQMNERKWGWQGAPKLPIRWAPYEWSPGRSHSSLGRSAGSPPSQRLVSTDEIGTFSPVVKYDQWSPGRAHAVVRPAGATVASAEAPARPVATAGFYRWNWHILSGCKIWSMDSGKRF